MEIAGVIEVTFPALVLLEFRVPGFFYNRAVHAVTCSFASSLCEASSPVVIYAISVLSFIGSVPFVQIRIRFLLLRIFFLNDSNIWCVQSYISQCGRTCACAVACLCPHNSITNVVVFVTIHDDILMCKMYENMKSLRMYNIHFQINFHVQIQVHVRVRVFVFVLACCCSCRRGLWWRREETNRNSHN